MTLVRHHNQLPYFVDRLFNNDEHEGLRKNHFSKNNSNLPPVNIIENKDEFIVQVAAPGFNKSDFNIELNEKTLTISSNKEETFLKEDERYTKQEFNFLSFTRTFTLPELVEDEKISATYTNGILELLIPKKEEAKPKPIKIIDIQ